MRPSLVGKGAFSALFSPFYWRCWLFLSLPPFCFRFAGAYFQKQFLLAFLECWIAYFLLLFSCDAYPCFLFMFSWIPLLTFKQLFKRGSEANLKLKAAWPHNFSTVISSSYDKAFEREKLSRHYYFIAVFSLIAVLLVTIYPYLPALNPLGRFVGVDIPFYEKKLLELNSLRTSHQSFPKPSFLMQIAQLASSSYSSAWS